MRLGLNGAGGTFVTTESVFLSPNSGWQSVVFPLLASDLTASDRGGFNFFDAGFDVDATLLDVLELRIFHSGGTGFAGDPIIARFGLDNVTSLPEPTAFALALVSSLVLALMRRGYRDP